MAGPGEMVSALAKVLGVPEPTVAVHDRNLAIAGLRIKKGRGLSAARMTPRDVSNLLIAVMGSSMVRDTVETVRSYSDLPLGTDLGLREVYKPHDPVTIYGIHEPQAHLWPFAVPELRQLSKEHTFGAALTGMISSAVDGSLQSAMNQLPNSAYLRFTFAGPVPGASIEIRIPQIAHDAKHYINPPLLRRKDSRPDKRQMTKIERMMREKYPIGDRRWHSEFSHDTIFAMGTLLNS
jgi:hypothetical protein